MTASDPFIDRLWVFSDLHLTEPDSSLYQSFLIALQEPNSSSDVVVFAGDIFEIFVGNSAYFQKKHSLFLDSVRELARRGVRMFYIQGNHDFHLEKIFTDGSVKVLDSELVLGKIYIAHGDLIDQNDHGYLKMRRLFRSRVFLSFVDRLPGITVEWIGKKMARSHDQKAGDLPVKPGSVPAVRPIFRRFAEEKKRQGFDFVILGHCHDLDDLQPFYFNMGYPPVHRQFLFYSAETGSFKRRIFIGI